MSNSTEQTSIMNELEVYLSHLNVSNHKLINQFLNSFKDYLITCGQILSKIEQPGHIYNLGLQNQLIYETDKFLLTADKLENVVPFDAKIKIRDIFRTIVGKYLFQSQILKRFYEKPRGYAGDYMMFEQMYDAKPVSQGVGIYFDYYVFRHSIVESVVYRKEKIKRILTGILDSNPKGSSPIKILNIGCGGAREVRELFNDNDFPGNVDFTLMDQDSEGLNYARSSLKIVRKKNVKFHFIQKNAMEMIGFSRKPVEKNSYDVIYSLGIVDYFLDNVFSRFIKHCYDMLKPNGRLIIAACSSRDMTIYIALRWLCEWNFYYRDAERVKKVIDETIESPSVGITWEEKKQIFFINLNKV